MSKDFRMNDDDLDMVTGGTSQVKPIDKPEDTKEKKSRGLFGKKKDTLTFAVDKNMLLSGGGDSEQLI